MPRDFHEIYDEPRIVPPPERSTGLVFSGISAFVAFLFNEYTTVLVIAIALCAGFFAVSLTRPLILRPLNIAWFRFSLLLHRIVNPLVLGLMFVIAILPFGLVMRLFRDPMQRKRSTGPTYWIARELKDSGTRSMTNQF